MTKSGSFRSRSFLLPAGSGDATTVTSDAVPGDDRIIRESGIDARIALIVEPILRGMGYRLVRVRLSGQNGLTLQVMAERNDGTMTVEDCEAVARAISAAPGGGDPVETAWASRATSA